MEKTVASRTNDSSETVPRAIFTIVSAPRRVEEGEAEVVVLEGAADDTVLVANGDESRMPRA